MKPLVLLESYLESDDCCYFYIYGPKSITDRQLTIHDINNNIVALMKRGKGTMLPLYETSKTVCYHPQRW
jgi:hypothetical protein